MANSAITPLSHITTIMFPPFGIPSGSFTLVTDELSAPADFLLHQAVAGHVKDHSKNQGGSPQKILVLSASEDLNRWKAIASKSNVDMAQHIASGLVQFTDLSCYQALNPGTESTLGVVYSRVAHIIHASGQSGSLVILDDVCTLEWIGFEPLDIFRFVRALRTVCRKVECTFVVRYHITSSDEVDSDQLRRLLEICTYHLEVKPLYSGRSGAVSGEIALHRGPAVRLDDGVRLVPRSRSWQYRLLDTGPMYFQKGTSEGVL